MKKQGQRKILITLVSAAPKRRLMGRQKAKKEPEVVGMDLTAADGTFEIAGVAVPGTLQVVAGDKADKKTIGEITISKTGAVENQGNIGTIQEPRIAPFTPKAKCKVSPKSKPSGQILQKIKLTADLTDSEKDGSITSAIVTKRQGSGSDFFLGTESGYFGVSDGNSTISIKLQAAAGKKIVVTGFGLKSAALAPDSDSGFQFSLYTDLDPTPVATEPFKWAPGCPDDGQLHRIYEYTSEERAWGNATIELTAFALVGKVHLAQLEIYGRVEASSVGLRKMVVRRMEWS